MSVRQNFSGTSPYEPIIGFSRAVRVGNHIAVSGTGPVGADDASAAEQARQCFSLITAVLERAGASLEHITRTRIYLTDVADWQAVGSVHGEFFAGIRPAATMLVVAALLDPRWKVEIEAEAILD
jgi:enamine deaminase RidA (YjgF/YER057c/UK114 family)